MAVKKSTQAVGFRLPKEMVRVIDKAAARENRTRTTQIIEILKGFVKEQAAQG